LAAFWLVAKIEHDYFFIQVIQPFMPFCQDYSQVKLKLLFCLKKEKNKVKKQTQITVKTNIGKSL